MVFICKVSAGLQECGGRTQQTPALYKPTAASALIMKHGRWSLCSAGRSGNPEFVPFLPLFFNKWDTLSLLLSDAAPHISASLSVSLCECGRGLSVCECKLCLVRLKTKIWDQRRNSLACYHFAAVLMWNGVNYLKRHILKYLFLLYVNQYRIIKITQRCCLVTITCAIETLHILKFNTFDGLWDTASPLNRNNISSGVGAQGKQLPRAQQWLWCEWHLAGEEELCEASRMANITSPPMCWAAVEVTAGAWPAPAPLDTVI